MALRIIIDEQLDAPKARWVAGGSREYRRILLVEVYDDGTPTVKDPRKVGPKWLLDALSNTAIGGQVSLEFGQAYEVEIDGPDNKDEDENATLYALDPRRDPREQTKWSVEAIYHTLAPGDNSYNASGGLADTGAWNTERPHFEFQFIQFSEWAKDGYRFGKPAKDDPGHNDPTQWQQLERGALTSSNGQLMLDPPPMRDVERYGLLVERNFNKIDMQQLADLANSVNTEPFTIQWQNLSWQIPKYWGRIKTLLPREYFRGGRHCWRVRYEIDVWSRSWVEPFVDKGYESIDFAAPLTGASLGEVQQSPNKRIDGTLTQGEVLLCEGKAKTWSDTDKIGTPGDPLDPVRFDISKTCEVYYCKYDLLDWNGAAYWMMSDFPNNVDQP